jgi:colicin import membrane protein
MMKRLLIAMLMGLPLAAAAQDNAWEKATVTTTANADQKYLEGAVPVVDGQVVFETTIKAPGKTGKQIYDIMLNQLQQLTQGPEQFEQSSVTLQNADQLQIVGNYQEWLVFKNKPLNLDRTRLFYHLFVDCRDGEATVKMTRIVYLYDEERDPQTYYANEWITDRYGLNKKKTKLSRVSGKFRKKTIDRKDNIFNTLESLLNQ